MGHERRHEREAEALAIVKACRPDYKAKLSRDLEEWSKRLGAVTSQIKTLERERDDINRMIFAAEVLLEPRVPDNR